MGDGCGVWVRVGVWVAGPGPQRWGRGGAWAALCCWLAPRPCCLLAAAEGTQGASFQPHGPARGSGIPDVPAWRWVSALVEQVALN